ncbi:MAG: peptide deformylase [Firmicutes bacterium]|nr:peptide deformylase [Bacillota bacterium]MCL2771274.1 peptide deformylase [Bacillota bacterium]
MALRNILPDSEPQLRLKAREVVEFDKNLAIFLDDMTETLIKANGVGLASNQVGILKRVVIMFFGEENYNAVTEDNPGSKKLFRKCNHQKSEGYILELINPRFISKSKEEVMGEEGCLSIDREGSRFYAEVLRSIEVEIEAQTRDGEKYTIKLNDWMARVAQHEIDHLDGILFIDYLKEKI